jgi:hypothetical protein
MLFMNWSKVHSRMPTGILATLRDIALNFSAGIEI